MSEEDDSEDYEVEGAEQLGDAGKKALDAMKAKWQSERNRRKELEPLAAKAREADEAAKTQAQKDADRMAVAERERDEARAELLRHRVAAAKGLPPDLAARLRGATEEELAKDADELLKLVKPPQNSPRPVADLRSGALPAGTAQGLTTSQQIDAEIRRAARRGN